MLDVALEAPRAVVGGDERGCVVGIADGRIEVVEEYGVQLAARDVHRLADDVVLVPGLVDTHVHVNEPGRTEWEGFAHATRAAAAGGVTTVIDMPLNSIPPTTDVEALELKRKAAGEACFVDVGFWGGAVPGNGVELGRLWDAGVFGFKCFLADSGVEEFPALSAADLAAVTGTIAGFGGLLLVHAEDPDLLRQAPDGTSYQQFAQSRPASAEVAAVRGLVEAARRTGCPVHVVHVSSAATLSVLRAAHEHGVPISAETCPHYLAFAAQEIADGDTSFKCCPPIRDAANRDELWTGIGDGTLSMVVSDHSPCPSEMKRLDTGNFAAAWGGVGSLQLGLAAVWTEARRRGHSLTDLARWMATAPADRVGLGRKGRIAAGADADFCVVAPDESFVVDGSSLHHRSPVTPYHGRTLTGVVREAWLAGRPIDLDAAPRGRLLTRGAG